MMQLIAGADYEVPQSHLISLNGEEKNPLSNF
jgi:hypothetical protein